MCIFWEMMVIMPFKLKKYSQLEVIVALFFSIEYLREMFILINPYLINVLSISFSLLIIISLKTRINKNVRVLIALISLFIFSALIHGWFLNFFEVQVLIYSIFKLTEVFAIVIFLSNVSERVFYNSLHLIVKVFIFINVVLFVYYFFALFDILPSVNRLVIFDYRFAGLSGEPAQFAQHCVFIIFSIFILMKNDFLNHSRFFLVVVFFMAAISFSNAIALLLLSLYMYYFFFVSSGNSLKKILGVFLLVPVGYLVINNVFTRLKIDFDDIYPLLNQLTVLADIPISSYDVLTSHNPVTVRIFEFMYSLSMINKPLGSGLGSTLPYSRYAGFIENDEFINMYGITQIGFELGYVPMIFLMIFLFWFLFYHSINLSVPIRLFIFSIVFFIFLMNGVGFKITWFFVFLLMINKGWFLKGTIRHNI